MLAAESQQPLTSMGACMFNLWFSPSAAESMSLGMQVKAEHTELEELREMKEDIVRRERAQAAIIDNQAKRLDELDSLYKVQL